MKLVYRYRVKSRFAGNTFRVFYSRPLPEGKILDGTSFSRDRLGNGF